jgi:Flp pilus assembly protein TadG
VTASRWRYFSALRQRVHSFCVLVRTKGQQLARLDRGVLRDESGAATLEFALTAIVLMTVVLGVMETTLALYSFDFICDAAREGARYAMVRGDTCVVNGASCTVTPAQVQTYVQSLGFPGINPAIMTVTSTYSAYPSGTACTPNANCANPGNLVTVSVVYAYGYSIPFVPVRTLQMKSTSSMVISQ